MRHCLLFSLAASGRAGNETFAKVRLHRSPFVAAYPSPHRFCSSLSGVPPPPNDAAAGHHPSNDTNEGRRAGAGEEFISSGADTLASTTTAASAAACDSAAASGIRDAASTTHGATDRWTVQQKRNGEKRMSISIRSRRQRAAAREPFQGAISSSADATARDSAPGDMQKMSTIHAGATSSESFAASPSSSSSLPTAATRTTTAAAVLLPSFNIGAASSTISPVLSAPSASLSSAIPQSSDPSSSPFLFSVSRFTEPVKRIILMRSGRSEANEDVGAYVTTPDWRIPLVEEGRRECIAAGRVLNELIGSDPVYFYYSPYIRSRQSLRYVLQGLDEARANGTAIQPEWWDDEEGATGCRETAAPPPSSQHPTAFAFSSSATSGSPESRIFATTNTAASTSTAPGNSGAQRNGAAAPPSAAALSPALVARCRPVPAPHAVGDDASIVLRSEAGDNIIGVREDVRLRDGDIGRYTSTAELMQHLEERERYGKFFYRFPYGESGADVCDRVTSFLDAFQRERVEFPMDTNVVIITHGLTMRMFIKRWFHLTVDTFHRMRSPPSGSLCTLTRLHHRSCFRLDESCVETMHLPLSLNEFNGYKYRNKKLLGSMSSGAPYM